MMSYNLAVNEFILEIQNRRFAGGSPEFNASWDFLSDQMPCRIKCRLLLVVIKFLAVNRRIGCQAHASL